MNVVNQIFEELDQDQSGYVSLEEFVNGYFVQLVQCEDRIADLEKILEKETLKREKAAEKLKEVRDEQVNEYGIMINSMLTAQIREARGLPIRSLDYEGGYQVVMQTENQRSKSEVARSKEGEPVWSEIMTFDI
jgi:hypothetical protein